MIKYLEKRLKHTAKETHEIKITAN